MRCAALHLPNLLVELAASEGARGVFAVVLAKAGSAVTDERSLRGGTRLAVVSSQARELGVEPGQTIAAARAKSVDLHVHVISIAVVSAVFARLAESLLAFGPCTSLSLCETDASESADGYLDAAFVYVDITGCAHLHASREQDAQDGERVLATRIVAHVAEQGHAAVVAIADGPRIAAAVARYGPTKKQVRIVPIGKSKQALAVLPVCALPLGAETTAWLMRLGLRTVADLQRLPRSSLGQRLGARAAEVMALLEGDDRAPLDRYEPPTTIEESFDLDDPVEATEALLFVCKRLCDRLAARLEGRGMAVARMELALKLDQARISVDSRESCASSAVSDLSLPAPLTASDDLLAVLRSKLESFAVPAPVRSVSLRVTSLVARTASARDLFMAEAKAERALPRLVAELEAELGAAHVGVLELVDRWTLTERSRLIPFAQRGRSRSLPLRALPDAPVGSSISRALEPSRFLSMPHFLGEIGEVHDVHPIRTLLRLDAIEWWRHGASRVDLVAAWVPAKSAIGWVEIDRVTGTMQVRGWID